MKQPLRLIDMLALKTLVAGVALVQGNPATGHQPGYDDEGTHSAQFPYLLEDTQLENPMQLAAAIYRLACRTNFAAPGYALLRQTKTTTSREQRASMVQLKNNLSTVHMALTGQGLGYFALSRFDQKNSSRPHRDGAPPQSLLLIGYEPSKTTSDLFLTDYAACAHQLGLSPLQFLEEFNPMYEKGLKILAPYVMPLVEFDPSFYNILIINNSSAPLNRHEGNWQGVLHYAQIGTPLGPRVINSMSLTPRHSGEADEVPPEAVQRFLENDALAEDAYAK